MMKRIVCLLVALMMFSGSALAEAYQLNISWEPDAAGTLEYLSKVTEMEGTTLENLADGYIKFAEGLGIQLNMQSTWMYLSLSVMDTVLLDLGMASDWDYCHILSSLWPGHYLTANVSADEAATKQQGWAALEGLDWTGMLADLNSVLEKWMASLSMTEEHGNFMGDAYAGGVLRRCYAFDDKAVAQLVDNMLAAIQDKGYSDEMMQDYLGDEIAPLKSLRQLNSDVSDANRFSYVLHTVYGPEDAYYGSSLVVLEAGEQVMTVSHGVAANGQRLVWGYGLNGENVYINFDLIASEEGQGKEFALVVYTDSARLGFRAVEAYSDYVRLMLAGTLTSWQAEGEYGWTADVTMIDPDAQIAESRYVLEGWENAAQQTAEMVMNWYISEENTAPAQTLRFTLKPCEPMTWSVDGLTPVEFAEGENVEQNELLSQLVGEATQELALKFFKLIPPQLFTLFMN